MIIFQCVCSTKILEQCFPQQVQKKIISHQALQKGFCDQINLWKFAHTPFFCLAESLMYLSTQNPDIILIRYFLSMCGQESLFLWGFFLCIIYLNHINRYFKDLLLGNIAFQPPFLKMNQSSFPYHHSHNVLLKNKTNQTSPAHFQSEV